MKRPIKKKFNSQAKDQAQSNRDVIMYNKAINNVNDWLPNEKEIKNISNKIVNTFSDLMLPKIKRENELEIMIFTAIAKRLK